MCAVLRCAYSSWTNSSMFRWSDVFIVRPEVDIATKNLGLWDSQCFFFMGLFEYNLSLPETHLKPDSLYFKAYWPFLGKMWCSTNPRIVIWQKDLILNILLTKNKLRKSIGDDKKWHDIIILIYNPYGGRVHIWRIRGFFSIIDKFIEIYYY